LKKIMWINRNVLSLLSIKSCIYLLNSCNIFIGDFNMANSLIEKLPKIVARGKKEAERILEGLSKSNRITLQTNELVLPTKAEGGYFGQNIKTDSKNDWFNRLIYGDNLLAMQALLAGDGNTPSMRGKIDLIYIDPPFDSKADYRTKIHLPGTDIEAKTRSFRAVRLCRYMEGRGNIQKQMAGLQGEHIQ